MSTKPAPTAESSEVIHARVKAEGYGRLAATAKTFRERAYYERMHKKWLGIAGGWRMIDEEVNKVPLTGPPDAA
jgi:hypothetical protein